MDGMTLVGNRGVLLEPLRSRDGSCIVKRLGREGQGHRYTQAPGRVLVQQQDSSRARHEEVVEQGGRRRRDGRPSGREVAAGAPKDICARNRGESECGAVISIRRESSGRAHSVMMDAGSFGRQKVLEVAFGGTGPSWSRCDSEAVQSRGQAATLRVLGAKCEIR
jgi:hypothetical protein